MNSINLEMVEITNWTFEFQKLSVFWMSLLTIDENRGTSDVMLCSVMFRLNLKVTGQSSLSALFFSLILRSHHKFHLTCSIISDKNVCSLNIKHSCYPCSAPKTKAWACWNLASIARVFAGDIFGWTVLKMSYWII